MRDNGNIMVMWLSSLSFAKGMARVIVFVIALLMLFQMRFGITWSLVIMACCYLPWALKVWWKPLFDHNAHFREQILLMQFLLAASFMALAFALPHKTAVVVLLLLIAWFTAIHNVAADAFCRLHPLDDRHAILREMFRRLAGIVGQGVLVMLAGNLQVFYRYDRFYSWRLMYYVVAGLFILLFLYHMRALPQSINDRSTTSHPHHTPSAQFLLGYLFAHALVARLGILFLVDTPSAGGLGLSPQEFGFVMGTVGIIGLTIGGVIGNKMRRIMGMHRLLWPMAYVMLLPTILYVMLSYWQPSDVLLISGGVFLEQLTYGFGLTLFLWYLKQVSQSDLSKSLMALSLMTGCLLSACLQPLMGYNACFVLALLLSALSPLVAYTIRKIPTEK